MTKFDKAAVLSAQNAHDYDLEYNASYHYIASLVFSSIGFALVSIVMALQLGLSQWGAKKYERATFVFTRKRKIDLPIIWTTACLMYLSLCNIISSSIWNGPLWMYKWDGHIWCDIDIRIQLFCTCGLITGPTAITRNLSLLVSAKGPPLYFQSRKKVWVDLLICAVFPTIQILLLYLYQSNRYAISETFGCTVVIYTSWISVLIYIIWVPIWSIVAAWYSILCVYYYVKRRREFNNVLTCTNSGLTTFQFARLLTFNMAIIFCMLPLSIYMVVVRVTMFPIDLRYSFKEAHEGYDNIAYIPYSSTSFADRWLYCTLTYVAFFIFGFGVEARMAYMRILDSLKIGWLFRAMHSYTVKKLSFVKPIFTKACSRQQYESDGGSAPQYRATIEICMTQHDGDSKPSYPNIQFNTRLEYSGTQESILEPGKYYNGVEDIPVCDEGLENRREEKDMHPGLPHSPDSATTRFDEDVSGPKSPASRTSVESFTTQVYYYGENAEHSSDSEEWEEKNGSLTVTKVKDEFE